MSDNEDTVVKWLIIMFGLVFFMIGVVGIVEKTMISWERVRLAEIAASTQPATQPAGERK